MADLIAQGPQPHQRWRRELPLGEELLIGREAGPWSVGWDEHISRRHALLEWRGSRLHVTRLPTARNPLFLHGEARDDFQLEAGEHFVIGQTTFTVSSDQLSVVDDPSEPLQEQAFSRQSLQQVPYRNAAFRLEVLSRLPDAISNALSDQDLFVRLVNILLAGIPRAELVALVAVRHEPEGPEVDVLHWDRRKQTGAEFHPSRRLINGAVERRQSVVHLRSPKRDATGSAYTLQENVDWAYCTPVSGEACAGWAIFVAGRFGADQQTPSPTHDPFDLREDLKFTELVASTLSSLRQVRALQQQQATLSHFFAPAVMRAMALESPEKVLAPRETRVSVLFCDLRGFSLSAERNADDLLALLNRVSQALGVMTHEILEFGGVLGDFQGDAAMGFWGWPLAQPDAVTRACQAALAIRREFEAAAQQPGHPLSDFRVGIGLATGKAVAGQIGTKDQVKVTVFGPVVNLASRLEGMTKLIRAPILIDATTAEALRGAVPTTVARCRRLARVRPYGMDKAVEIAELLPPEADDPRLTDAHLAAYEQALDAFLEGHWSEAMEFLQQVPAKDRVKDFLTVFIAQHNRTPPRGWDGVIELTSK